MEDVRGQLAVGILADVLRHAAFLRESGRVDVSSERNQGWVVVRDGLPMHAVCRRPDGTPAHGLEALATMLSWSEGSYAFEVELPGLARDTGSVPADAFLDDEGGPRTLSGDTETVLKEARAYSGHRNGHLAQSRPRFTLLRSVEGDRTVPERVGSPSVDGAPPYHPAPAAPAPAAPTPAASSPAAPSHAGSNPTPSHPPVATASRLRPSSVLTRLDVGDPESRVTASIGALDLWRHLDGATPLAGWCQELDQDGAVLVRRADELVRVGLAVAEPEPVYGAVFVAGLTDSLNEIMGPMGEIVVQDAIAELDLDPGNIPLDRVDDLTAALASHLHRSDWQLKLRARVARLRAETMETRTEALP